MVTCVQSLDFSAFGIFQHAFSLSCYCELSDIGIIFHGVLTTVETVFVGFFLANFLICIGYFRFKGDRCVCLLFGVWRLGKTVHVFFTGFKRRSCSDDLGFAFLQDCSFSTGKWPKHVPQNSARVLTIRNTSSENMSKQYQVMSPLGSVHAKSTCVEQTLAFHPEGEDCILTNDGEAMARIIQFSSQWDTDHHWIC